MNIFEQINELMKIEGVSAQEIATKWAEMGLLDVSKLRGVNVATTEIISSISDVKPGMFLSRNGKICKNFIADDIEAIILSIFNNEALALCLHKEILPFSSDGFCVDTSKMDALSATKYICEKAKESGKKVEAAQYCVEYESFIVKKGTAFLLSEKEKNDMRSYYFNLKEAFGLANLKEDLFWTAITNGCTNMVGLCSIGSFYFYEDVTTPLSVQPAFLIDLKSLPSLK